MAIITAEQFKQKARAIITIPGFDAGETFEVEVKKLSLVGLMSSGKIPNPLMKTVQDAFEGLRSENTREQTEAGVMDKASDIGKLLDIVCEEAMVNPLYKDVRDVMNDEQKLAVFEFTQRGVQEVQPFPTIEGNPGLATDVKDV